MQDPWWSLAVVVAEGFNFRLPSRRSRSSCQEQGWRSHCKCVVAIPPGCLPPFSTLYVPGPTPGAVLSAG